MKHKGIWIVGILLLIVIGLGLWIYPKVVFVKAVLSFSKVDSVHIEGTLTLSNGEYDLDLQGTANYNNHILHGDFSTDYLWNPVSSELYVDTNHSAIRFYLTTNLSNNWITSSQKINGDFGSKLKSTDISFKDIRFKKVKSDRNKEKKYQIRVSKKAVLPFLTSYVKNSENMPEIITFYIYLKDNSISGLTIPDKIILSEEDNLYLSNIDLRFSSWNGISTIEIPSNVKEKSKEIEENVLETLFS